MPTLSDGLLNVCTKYGTKTVWTMGLEHSILQSKCNKKIQPEKLSNNSSYVYLHLNPIDESVFYVGISNDDNNKKYNRANRIHNRSKYWNNYVKKYGFDIKIYKEDISWEEACRLEIFLIKKYGRKDIGTGNLVNLTDGGEGIVNLSDESKELSSIRLKNIWSSGRMDFMNKHVYKYSDNGVIVESFNSVKEAGAKSGICITEISACARGVRARAGGFYWSYSNCIVKIPTKPIRSEKQKIGIVGYSIKEDVIYHFDSEIDADVFFNKPYLSTSISKCLKSHNNKANEILWFIEKHDKMKAFYEIEKIRGEMFIVRIDNSNNIRIFTSLKEACALTENAKVGNVGKCLHNRQKSAYGYKWVKLKNYYNGERTF